MLFLSRYKNDPTKWSPPVSDVLETVFGAVDEYVEDPALTAQVRWLDPLALRDEVDIVLGRLVSLREREDL